MVPLLFGVTYMNSSIKDNHTHFCNALHVKQEQLMAFSLYVIQMCISPPHLVCNVVYGQCIRPAQLLRNDFAAVSTIHTNTSYVRR